MTEEPTKSSFVTNVPITRRQPPEIATEKIVPEPPPLAALTKAAKAATIRRNIETQEIQDEFPAIYAAGDLDISWDDPEIHKLWQRYKAAKAATIRRNIETQEIEDAFPAIYDAEDLDISWDDPEIHKLWHRYKDDREEEARRRRDMIGAEPEPEPERQPAASAVASSITEANPGCGPYPRDGSLDKRTVWALALKFPRTLPQSAARVLIYIARCDGERGAYPGMRKIAENTGLHIETVQENVKRLRRLGLLEVETLSGYRSNFYTIHGPEDDLES